MKSTFPPAREIRSRARQVTASKRESPDARAERRWTAALCASLFSIVLAVFSGALRNGFTYYDDPDYVTENPHLQGGLSLDKIRWAFSSGYAGNWHPVTWLSHLVDLQLFGLQPWGHHLTGIVLHALNSVLVFLVWRRATGARWPSLFVAAMFGLHPLHVESAVWVAERKDVLSAFFWLLTIWAYLRYARGEPSSAPASLGGSATVNYSLSLVSFALGLMSKPMLVTLPFVLLLLDYWPLNRVHLTARRSMIESAGRLVVEKLPFFALAAAASAVTFLVQKQAGAMHAIESHTLAFRLENSAISYGRYLGKLLIPARLAVFYPYPEHWPPAVVAAAVTGLLTATVLVILHGRRHPYLPVGWLWYLGTLVPVIGLVQVGAQALADRYTYIPILGILILGTFGAVELTNGWRHQRTALTAAASLSLLLCAAATIRQIGFWKDTEALFRHALAVTPANEVACVSLGVALTHQGRLDEAIEQFRAALRLQPESFEAHLNLAATLAMKSVSPEAFSEFRTALRIAPESFEAHNDLGVALGRSGHLSEAAAHFRAAVRLQPDRLEGHKNLALALAAQGATDEAIAEFREMLKLQPGSLFARQNLEALIGNQPGAAH